MSGDSSDPRDTFSGSAERYLASSDHISGPDLDAVRTVASDLSPDLTVDVASGAGHALRAAAPWSRYCVATDLTVEMLQVARDHLAGAGFYDTGYVLSAARELPFADSTVSLLTCRIAPHHFESVPDFLAEVTRVLADQGRAVIIDSLVPDDDQCDRFINTVERLRDPSHVRSHRLDQWLVFFENARLETVTTEIFSRVHPFSEWAGRTGRDQKEIETVKTRFLKAPPRIRERFQIVVEEGEDVVSYTDEKGIFILKRKQ